MTVWNEPESATPQSRQIIAIGLLTAHDVSRLGPGFKRLYPIDETPCFNELLRAIDEADRDIRQARGAPAKP